QNFYHRMELKMQKTTSEQPTSERTSEGDIHQPFQVFGSNATRIAMVSDQNSSSDTSGLRHAFSMIVSGSLSEAKSNAHTVAESARESGNQDVTKFAGWIWQIADGLYRAQQAIAGESWSTAKDAAHQAAERTRALKRADIISEEQSSMVEQTAGRYWQEANQAEQTQGGLNGKGEVGPYAAWTTGGGSFLLPRENWGASNLRPHHSDRTNSAAANRVRQGSARVPYNSVDAYDVTFEKLDANGQASMGTAQGLPLMTPIKSRVADIQTTYQGSGDYGKFIILEYLEGDLAGQRVAIHHLDTVRNFRIGETLSGGVVFGTQGSSGNRRFVYDPHVDIVGTAEAVVLFVKANQSGQFETNTTPSPTAPTVQDNTESSSAPTSGEMVAPSLGKVRDGTAMLKMGMTGESVAHIQRLLRIQADGIFGSQTHAAVEAFQRNTKLTPPPGLSGVVGQTTLQRLERPQSELELGEPGAMGIAPLAISFTESGTDYPPQLIAFSRAISYVEGTADAKGYNREVGGKDYGSGQQVHPGAETEWRYMQTGYNSDAYGRFQMLSSTWASWAQKADIPTARPGQNSYGEAYYDISPQFQDKAVLEFLMRQGIAEFLLAGNISRAVWQVNRTWSSLPGGPQPNGKTRSFYDIYDKMLREEIQRNTSR
ncbi:MAG: peptidoglycan-binding protein, partial [Myxococcota bacterium]|nr:peptidoglycan-binding protein [Myxococcota bacterium]